MAMATIVNGIQQQIAHDPNHTDHVLRDEGFSQTPLNPDALPKWVRVRPDLDRRRR
jgi:hypothetical protein